MDAAAADTNTANDELRTRFAIQIDSKGSANWVVHDLGLKLVRTLSRIGPCGHDAERWLHERRLSSTLHKIVVSPAHFETCVLA